MVDSLEERSVMLTATLYVTAMARAITALPHDTLCGITMTGGPRPDAADRAAVFLIFRVLGMSPNDVWCSRSGESKRASRAPMTTTVVTCHRGSPNRRGHNHSHDVTES